MAIGLAQNDPENSFFSMQFPEYYTKGKKEGTYGNQIVAPASFAYEDTWKTGPEGTRGGEYKELKQRFAEALIQRAESYIPGLGPHILHLDVATPVTMHRYTLNDQGAAVGWSYKSRHQ